MAEVTFSAPLRYIFDANDHHAFSKSHAHDDLLKFIAAINAAVVDKPCSTQCHMSPVAQKIVDALQSMLTWVDEIPPLQQAMRYGNKAFRMWHARLVRELVPMCKGFTEGLASAQGAHVELAAYLVDAFGNATRIDYGTGHETCFLLFLYCASRAGLLTKEDLPAMGLKMFPAYLKVCRKLQRTYWLEPAGSHGVWSLDDYQFLVFLFGSAQLLNHKHIKPRSIHSAEILDNFAEDYMYLGAIAFINEVKSGAPFAEHSPILNDIAELPHWGKVNEGLAKMYKAEVLGKLPVVQHMVFGGLWKADWEPSRQPVPSDSAAHLYAHMQALESGAGEAVADAAAAAIKSPPGADEVPTDRPEQAVAPWATEPVCLHKHHHHDASGGAGQPPLTTTGVAPWATGAGHSHPHAHPLSAGASAGHAGAPAGLHGIETQAPWARQNTPAGATSPGAERPSGSSFHEAFPGLKHVHAARSPGPAGSSHPASPTAVRSPQVNSSSSAGQATGQGQ